MAQTVLERRLGTTRAVAHFYSGYSRPRKAPSVPGREEPFKAWLSLEAGSRERAAQLLKLETELKEEKCSRQSP
jgi:hypothetical protein